MAFATCTSSTLVFFLLLLPQCAITQTTNGGRIAVNAYRTAANNPSNSWLSPSEDFAFGFHRLDNNNSEDRFLLSIWFHKIPAKTVVWWAVNQDGNPVVVPSGSKVTLTAGNGLVLTDPRGAELWKSDIAMQTVDHGVMYDTGNFAIESRASEMLWQSFEHPTDTLLPTQPMMIGGQLFSRSPKKGNEFEQGKFLLRLSESGDLELKSVSLPTKRVYDEPYYSSKTNNSADSWNSGNRLVFNESGDVYVLRRNGQTSSIATEAPPIPSSDFYQRVTLDSDGVFAQYYYPKKSTGSGSWSTVWYKPDNICSRVGYMGTGACGFNNVCKLNGSGRPICECPPGFSLLDPDDSYGSCKRDAELDCDGQLSVEDVYDIKVLVGTNFAFSDYELNDGPSYEAQQCRTACLQDCMCAVAIYNTDVRGCWKKRLPVSNGMHNNNDKSTLAFFKVRKGDHPPTSPSLPKADEDEKQNFKITGSILLGTSFSVNLALIAAFCFTLFLIYKKRHSKNNDQCQIETNLRFFTYKELIEATNGFQEEIGRGAFGVVYKGTSQMAAGGSRTNIAVKKLDGMLRGRDGHKEFKAEINVIGKTHHKNLVRLLGACEDRQQRLLVYEFLSNGTLAEYLFRSIKPSWNQRTQIALGIARGLLYLHEECRTQIIHCDIKPRNILLDEYCNACISDFGLAKLLKMDQTQTKTDIRGTKGYVAPEWFRNMPVTVKVDVYSFGVVLLEIICCRRSVEDEEMGDGENTILTYWAYDCYQRGATEDLVRDDMEAINDMKSLEKFLMVAFWCIQEDPYLRPTMRKVTQMLEGVVPVTIPPNPSPFSTIE